VGTRNTEATVKSDILVTRRIPEAGLDLLREGAGVEVLPGDIEPTKQALLEKIRGRRGLLCLLTDPIDADVIAAGLGTLEVISNYAVGYDNIDVAAATAAGIPVGNTPGVLTETTADLAFSLLMSSARRIVEGAAFARAGKWRSWSPTLLLGRDVHGATLGILGMGRIGRAMARRATGFGMKIIYFDPDVEGEPDDLPGKPVSLDELAARSDFLSIHAPLNGETRGLVDARFMASMKREAILINTARGGLVDQDALVEALTDGVIGGAALDVTEPEPLPADHPLYSLPDCIIVPHLGSASVATRDRMAVMAAQNLLAGLNGERLPHCVNPEVYRGS